MENDIVYPGTARPVDAAQSTIELIKNLKMLAEEFQCLESSKEGLKFLPLARHLMNSKLLKHQSKEVKLFVGCCLADILRNCAPEKLPLKDNELREMFTFFLRVLRGLEDLNSSNYHRYFYVLECLAASKSFLLIVDLQSTESAITLTGKLFNLFFHVVTEEHVGKARSLMLDIMSSLMAEESCMNNEILELVYQHILPPFKHQMPAAYSLASDLLRLTSHSIESHVLNFFTDVLASLDGNEDGDSFMTPAKTPSKGHSASGNGVSKGHSLTVQRIYELLYEVYATAPSTLSSVLPLLEMKLKSVEVNDRLLSVKCLGRMFGHENCQLYLDNNNLWSSFVSRARDATVEVRLEFLKSLPQIMQTHYEEVAVEVSSALNKLSRDLNLDVRKETIKTIEATGLVNFSLVNAEMLAAVKDRTRDTVFAVRKIAMQTAAKWYHEFCSTDKNANLGSALWSQTAPRVKLSWVADKLLANYLSPVVEERNLVEKLLCGQVLAEGFSPEDDEGESEPRVSSLKLLEVFCLIDSSALKIFQVLLKQGIIKKHGFDCKAAEDLIHLVASFLTRPDEHVLNNNHYFWNEMPEPSKRKQASYLENLGSACDFMIQSTSESKLRSIVLLEYLISFHPDCFQSFSCLQILVDIMKKIVHRHVSVVYDVVKTFMRTLVLFCNVVLSNASLLENQGFETLKKDLLEAANKIMKFSTDPKFCKYAVILSNCVVFDSAEKKSMFEKLFKQLTATLSLSSSTLLGCLGAASQIALICARDLHSEIQTFVSKFIVKNLLELEVSELKNNEDKDRLIKAKVYGLKMICRWLIGLNESDLKLVQSSLKMFTCAIVNEGRFGVTEETSDRSSSQSSEELSAIKLTAAKMILKLNTVPNYALLLTEQQFNDVASVILDADPHVRSSFAAKLDKHFISQRLPLKFLAIFALCGREPDNDLKERCREYFKKNIKKRKYLLKSGSKSDRGSSPESKHAKQMKLFLKVDNVMLYVIHVLTHFHEFDSTRNFEVLKALKDCLWFVMQVLMQDSEDFSYSYHKFMLDNLKMCQDALAEPEDAESHEKLYAVIDLALTLLNARVKNFDSIPVTQFSLAIPTKLYRVAESNSRLNSKVYIPASLMEKPKANLDSAIVDKGKKKLKAIRNLSKEAENDLKTSPDEKPTSQNKQPKISDHVVTSFVSKRTNRSKKRHKSSSGERQLSESGNDSSPEVKFRIQKKKNQLADCTPSTPERKDLRSGIRSRSSALSEDHSNVGSIFDTSTDDISSVVTPKNKKTRAVAVPEPKTNEKPKTSNRSRTPTRNTKDSIAKSRSFAKKRNAASEPIEISTSKRTRQSTISDIFTSRNAQKSQSKDESNHEKSKVTESPIAPSGRGKVKAKRSQSKKTSLTSTPSSRTRNSVRSQEVDTVSVASSTRSSKVSSEIDDSSSREIGRRMISRGNKSGGRKILESSQSQDGDDIKSVKSSPSVSSMIGTPSNRTRNRMQSQVNAH